MPSLRIWLFLLVTTLILSSSESLLYAQEGFKGERSAPPAFYKRPVKKLNNGKHNAGSRISAKALEANNRGSGDFDNGQYDAAIANYKEAVRFSPGYAEAYLNLGDAYLALKRNEEAIAAFKRAIRLKANYDDAYNGLGDAYTALGKEDEAEDAYARARANYASGKVLNGKALSLPAPAYPALAKSARASGPVTVQVVVDETGQVLYARAISGHPLLQSAAVQAASKARFSPTIIGDQPVKMTGTIIYNFNLN